MPINLDITQNAWFKHESKKLLAEGRRQGRKEEQRNAIVNMLKSGTLSMNEIAKIMGISIEFVQEINSSIK